MKKTLLLFATLAVLVSCQQTTVEPGVSRELALERHARVSELSYGLDFSIPDKLEEPCEGWELITFTLKGRAPLLLDWRPGGQSIKNLEVNGIQLEPDARNEHIVIPRRVLKKGRNEVHVSFIPEEATLNRHSEYLYTLLVPERARTLFPCFDQPDLKARFSLELIVPSDWVAVSNGAAVFERVNGHRKSIGFRQSGLVSTYLFEICAGRWEVASFGGDNRPINIHYRETDPAKLAQLPDIHRQITSALEWMEEYTGIPMPFDKYDCVIVPGFQFGGMEHPGAILYNEGRMFLPPQPTDAEKLSRMELIAHETAHLWFGDAVTMEWFDDVWTKEVFANHFAAMMCRPEFP
ncbi:MAG: aminopeptidase, partial [Bacteroidales bacterium]|nr:aminopeptidase [Bacteroidales bacterium]